MNFSTMLGRQFKGHMDTLGRITGVILFDRIRSTAQGKMKVGKKILTIDGVYRDGMWRLDLLPEGKGPFIVLNIRRPHWNLRRCSGNYDSMSHHRGKAQFVLA